MQNDLRPDISKDPWVSREEYILARAHCDVGNQWAEIAKYLPGRSENSIKVSKARHCTKDSQRKYHADMRLTLPVLLFARRTTGG